MSLMMMTTSIKGNARNYFSSKLVKRFTKIPTLLSNRLIYKVIIFRSFVILKQRFLSFSLSCKSKKIKWKRNFSRGEDYGRERKSSKIHRNHRSVFLDEKWIFICTNASHMSTASTEYKESIFLPRIDFCLSPSPLFCLGMIYNQESKCDV